MLQKTILHSLHQALNGKLVDFAGWDMPLHYGSQLEEHHQVRRDCGMFDVSHMVIVDISGSQARDFLRILLANDVAKLIVPGKALYSCMLNEQGGIMDDLIAYWCGDGRYRLVLNAGTREKDLAWLKKQRSSFDVVLELRDELAIIAIQGPQAISKCAQVFEPELYSKIAALKPFTAVEQGEYFIARTGYTGEDGLEVMIPTHQAASLWQKLLDTGVKPCGLGARDTLRLEAGLNLYGTDMDETTHPLESNLAWTVAWEPQERQFIGRAALATYRSQPQRKLVGLVLEQKGVLRNHQKVIVPNVGEGEITSGSFSPTLQQAIALARVPIDTGDHCYIEIRGQLALAHVVKPLFVRQGKAVI